MKFNKVYAGLSLLAVVLIAGFYFNARVFNKPSQIKKTRRINDQRLIGNQRIVREQRVFTKAIIPFDLVNSSLLYAVSSSSDLRNSFEIANDMKDLLEEFSNRFSSLNDISPNNFNDFISSLSAIETNNLQRMMEELKGIVLGRNITTTIEVYFPNFALTKDDPEGVGTTVTLTAHELEGGGHIYTATYTDDNGTTTQYHSVGEGDDDSTAMGKLADALEHVKEWRKSFKEKKENNGKDDDDDEEEGNKIIAELDRHIIPTIEVIDQKSHYLTRRNMINVQKLVNYFLQHSY